MILHSSKNGQIFICNQCRKIHLEFGNFSIDFSSLTDLREFLTLLEQIDGLYYEELNKHSAYKRKIMVQVPESRMKVLFTFDELKEIKSLLKKSIAQNNSELVSVTRIEVDFRTFTSKHLN